MVCSVDREAAHDHEPAAGDQLLVDLARRTVDVGMADVLALDGVARQVAHPRAGPPRARRRSPASRRYDEVVVARRSRTPTHAIGSCTCSVWIAVLIALASFPTGIARGSRGACAPAASVMNPTSVPALDEPQARARRARSSSSRSRMPAMPKMASWSRHALATVRTASRNAASRNCAEDPHLRGEVVRADHHHVDARHRRDLVGAARPRRASRASPPRWSARRRRRAARAAASRGSGWPGSARPPSGGPAAGTGRRRRSLGLGARLDVRDDHAHRADVERPGEVLVVVRRARAPAA